MSANQPRVEGSASVPPGTVQAQSPPAGFGMPRMMALVELPMLPASSRTSTSASKSESVAVAAPMRCQSLQSSPGAR